MLNPRVSEAAQSTYNQSNRKLVYNQKSGRMHIKKDDENTCGQKVNGQFWSDTPDGMAYGKCRCCVERNAD